MAATLFPSSPAIISFTEMATSISEVRQSHAHMLKSGLIHDPYSAARLISSAISLSPQSLLYPHSIFSYIQNPNSYSYNTLIRAYTNSSTPENSFNLFMNMLFDDGIEPDKYTFTFVLKACSALTNVSVGKQVHGHVIKFGVGHDVYICNTLIHMYAKGGLFEIARNLLDKMSGRDVISWNAILSAYSDMGGMMKLAQELFDEMPERNAESWNFMISGYVKDGMITEARSVFDDMPMKDVVSWNLMITGYAHEERFDQVFLLFKEMQDSGMIPDDYTLVNVLSSCARVNALSQGEWIHAYIHKNKIEIHGFLATALVDMYSKCGYLDKALQVFNKTSKKDISTWNSMISGFSLHGSSKSAINLFYKLLSEGFKPNEVTFVTVLSACSRSGLLEEAHKIYKLMVNDHGITPKIEHYGCMVDLLGRFGLLNEAEKLATKVPLLEKSQVIWESLLGACRTHNNYEMAERVTKKLLELDPQNSSGYVQLSNVHASKGQFISATQLRKKMKAKGVFKNPGCSIIEIDGIVHEFLAGEGIL